METPAFLLEKHLCLQSHKLLYSFWNFTDIILKSELININDAHQR